MIRRYWTRYLPSYPKVLLYMLQDTEYRLGRYLAWYHRTHDFRYVMKRRQLEMTTKVRLLLLALRLVGLLLVAAVAVSLYLGLTTHYGWWFFGIGLTVAAPYILAYGLVIPLGIGWLLVQKPRERMIIKAGQQVLARHAGRRIAIAGSYGKTTAKEILLAVLSEGLKTAATPGNMNTALGISRFARTLKGNEEVLIFELGEEKPGDVRKLARLTHPEIGIIVGANEAHLQSFKTLDRTVATIFELADFVESDQLYKNRESQLVADHTDKRGKWFDRRGTAGWKITHASTSVEGTTFTMTKGTAVIHTATSLVGLQTVGVTAAAAAIAYELGLTVEQIEAGLLNVRPFEHRMESRPLHGAWIIDDTYNGNSEGVKAGLGFLRTADAKRRVYVTPGLVEQGSRTQAVHEAIGEQAAVSADVVILMKNSVTDYILAGLERGGFKGLLMIIDDPLDFYVNLDQFVAAGDVILMQNDWTDNYA